MAKTNYTIKGLLCIHHAEHDEDLLFLSSVKKPLASYFESIISNKKVSVQYWISDKEASEEELNKDFTKKLFGITKCEFGARYSEYTGYLYTDEFCKVGGHDLLSELYSFVGKWLILKIEIH